MRERLRAYKSLAAFGQPHEAVPAGKVLWMDEDDRARLRVNVRRNRSLIYHEQSMLEYLLGRWKCPNCGAVWQTMSFLNDGSTHTVEDGRVTERQWDCHDCPYKRVDNRIYMNDNVYL